MAGPPISRPNMTVEQTAAYLDAQYAAMSARIQALEVEIASLQDSLNNTEDETERAAVLCLN